VSAPLVLVVEDDPSVRGLLQTLLTAEGYEVPAEQARETVRAIFDSPVNFLDTSRNYGSGRSEERIGEVIRERGGVPPGFVISSKLDRDMGSGRFDGARARRSLEESLKALNVGHIQLLHVHDPEYASSLSDVTGPRGALAELFRMKEEGLAEAVGLAAVGVVEDRDELARREVIVDQEVPQRHGVASG
jgi:D-threo-aldose 1-dehydrogenase